MDIRSTKSEFLLCLLCLLLPGSGGAATRWARLIGGSAADTFYSAQQTADGGYILAGNSKSFGAGVSDLWCVKLDVSGSIVWQRTLGHADEEGARCVRQTADGGYIVTGERYPTVGAPATDAWCVKLDGGGNVAWQRTYGGAGSESGWDIRQTPDGGYVLVGRTSSYGAGDTDAWCLKLDSGGNVAWQKTYGGAAKDYVRTAYRTTDGGYFLTGSTYSFGAGSADGWCLRVDASGNVVWQRAYGGAADDHLAGGQQTADGGYIVAGWAKSFGAGDFDSWVMKLDGSGNVAWQRSFGGASGDAATSVMQTSDGGYALGGYTPSFGAGGLDAWCIRLDSGGNVSWQRTYGASGDDAANTLNQTSDWGFILAGDTTSFGAASMDAWVLRIGSDGLIDPSCGTLAISSYASAAVSTAAATLSGATSVLTPAAGAVTAAAEMSSSASTAVLCSGGETGPTITAIKSKTGKPGSTATIVGTGFSPDKTKNVVYFGRRKAGSISRATATSLKLTIPKAKGTVGVYVKVNGVKSNTFTFTVK